MKDKQTDAVVTNPGNAFRFQFGGAFFELPGGESFWPYDIADHLRRKFRGVTAAVRNAVAIPVATPQVASQTVIRLGSKPEREADEKIAQRRAEEAAAEVAAEAPKAKRSKKDETPEPPAAN